MGSFAGQSGQQDFAVALGYQSGVYSQGTGSVAIGYQAGYTGQGTNAIAIGSNAGAIGQTDNSIVINASGATLPGSNPGFYVNPVRGFTGPTGSSGSTGSYPLTYELTSSEIYQNSGDIVVGGNLYVNGNFLQIGSNQIRSTLVTLVDASGIVNLTAANIAAGIITLTNPTNVVVLNFPQANTLFPILTFGTTFQLFINSQNTSINSRIDIGTIGAGGSGFGVTTGVDGLSTRILVIQIISQTEYNLYY